MRFHRFRSFVAAFLSIDLLYKSTSMSIINRINCKVERKTETYTFALSIFSESSLNRNLLVFEDLKVIQIGIEKTDKS